jgi:hypothetical protein
MISEILKQCSTSPGTPVSPEDQQKTAYITKPVDENVVLFVRRINDLRDGVACQLTSLNQRLESADAARQRDDKMIHVLKENIRQLEEKLEQIVRQKDAEEREHSEAIDSLSAQWKASMATTARMGSEIAAKDRRIAELEGKQDKSKEDSPAAPEPSVSDYGCGATVLLAAILFVFWLGKLLVSAF